MMNQIKNEERLSKEIILGYVRQMMSDPQVKTYKQRLDKLCKNKSEDRKTELKYEIFDELYENYLSEKYSDLNDRYPGIVKMFTNDTLDGVPFDLAKLEQLLNMLSMMRSRQEEGDGSQCRRVPAGCNQAAGDPGGGGRSSIRQGTPLDE